MTVWRIHLRASGVNPDKHCLEKGIVGVGWQVDNALDNCSLEEYWKLGRMKYGNSRWWSAPNAIAKKMQIDDLVWTRDEQGCYYLGRVVGDWFYDTTEAAKKADIVNVRKCEWHKIGTAEKIPGKVVSCFSGRGRAVQKIDGGDTINNFSQKTYNKATRNQFYKVGKLSNADIFSLLSSDDCEDALAIYLYLKYDYFIIPSTCKKNTMGVEYVLINKKTGKSAVAQVKSGNVRLNRDVFSKFDTDVFLFATCGQYYGSEKPNITTINPCVIKEFLYEPANLHLLPEKIRTWVEETKEQQNA